MSKIYLVTGVKGNNESEFRSGNVNITPENIGALSAEDSFNGATETSAGKAGCVPAPNVGETDRYLCSDGKWQPITLPIFNSGEAMIDENPVPIIWTKAGNIAIVYFAIQYIFGESTDIILPSELQGFTGGYAGLAGIWNTGNAIERPYLFTPVITGENKGKSVQVVGDFGEAMKFNNYTAAWGYCLLTYA